MKWLMGIALSVFLVIGVIVKREGVEKVPRFLSSTRSAPVPSEPQPDSQQAKHSHLPEISPEELSDESAPASDEEMKRLTDRLNDRATTDAEREVLAAALSRSVAVLARRSELAVEKASQQLQELAKTHPEHLRELRLLMGSEGEPDEN